jgi:hypothetical protein
LIKPYTGQHPFLDTRGIDENEGDSDTWLRNTAYETRSNFAHMCSPYLRARRFPKWNKFERSSSPRVLCRRTITGEYKRLQPQPQRSVLSRSIRSLRCFSSLRFCVLISPSSPSSLISPIPHVHSPLLCLSLFLPFSHGLSKRPILRFLFHRFLTLSHSTVLAFRRYFFVRRPCPSLDLQID